MTFSSYASAHTSWTSSLGHQFFLRSTACVDAVRGRPLHFAIALVVCSFIAMVLTYFVEFGRLEWHMMVDALQVCSLSSRAKRRCWREPVTLQQLDEMSRSEFITLQQGQLSWSENLHILCGRLLLCVSISSCDLRR